MLLPPPSKHRVTTKLSEHFELLKRTSKSSRVAATISLPQSRIGPSTASNEHLYALTPRPSSPIYGLPRLHHEACSRQRRSNFLLTPHLLPQIAPYRLSNGTPSPLLGLSPYSRIPQGFGYDSHPRHLRRVPHGQVAVSLMEIKRRRSLLLDFRECALDLLDETSTVLRQLEKASLRLSASRQRAAVRGR